METIIYVRTLEDNCEIISSLITKLVTFRYQPYLTFNTGPKYYSIRSGVSHHTWSTYHKVLDLSLLRLDCVKEFIYLRFIFQRMNIAWWTRCIPGKQLSSLCSPSFRGDIVKREVHTFISLWELGTRGKNEFWIFFWLFYYFIIFSNVPKKHVSYEWDIVTIKQRFRPLLEILSLLSYYRFLLYNGSWVRCCFHNFTTN